MSNLEARRPLGAVKIMVSEGSRGILAVHRAAAVKNNRGRKKTFPVEVTRIDPAVNLFHPGYASRTCNT